MARKLASLIILLLAVAMAGCEEKPQEAKAKGEPVADPKRAQIQEQIDKTTPEGKEMLEKVKAMKPVVNDQVSGKTLNEIVDQYANQSGDVGIKPVGWEASLKQTTKNWKIVFHFQDFNKQYRKAEWEYNPETQQLYPFELEQAPTFWTGIGAEAANSNTTKGKGK